LELDRRDGGKPRADFLLCAGFCAGCERGVSNQSVARRKRGGNHDFRGLELNRRFHRL